MKIDDLERETGQTPRQIRFLISEGFIPPPVGVKRGAEYGDEHVAAIRRYLDLRRLGLTPGDIKALQAGERPIAIEIGPGVTLVVAPEKLGSGTDPRAAGARVAEVLNTMMKETNHAEDRRHDQE